MRRTVASGALVLAVACGVSTQKEVELGTQYAQQINAQLPIVGDPEVNRYINVLGDSLARLSDDRNLDWQFTSLTARRSTRSPFRAASST
jgi:predicted Zn-dependent protease